MSQDQVDSDINKRGLIKITVVRGTRHVSGGGQWKDKRVASITTASKEVVKDNHVSNITTFVTTISVFTKMKSLTFT